MIKRKNPSAKTKENTMKKPAESLEKKFEKVDAYLIGVWRFKEWAKAKNWCATYCVDGDYLDIYPKATIEAALDDVAKKLPRAIRAAKARGKKKFKHNIFGGKP